MGEEGAGDVGVLGRHPEALFMASGIGGADIVQVGHGGDIDPGVRRGHHHIGKAEAQRLDHGDAAGNVRRAFAQQVFAGDAQMDVAAEQRGGDLARREQHHIDTIQAANDGAVAARAGLLQRQSGLGEGLVAFFLEAALGRDGERQRHGAPLTAASSRSVRKAKPIAVTGSAAPSSSRRLS
jgi:hypothetical protein